MAEDVLSIGFHPALRRMTPIWQGTGANHTAILFQHYKKWDVSALAHEAGSVCSLFTSSTETISNCPGAGRTLGNLYSRWGHALEISLGTLAHKRGFGPDAVAERIHRFLSERWLFSYDDTFSFGKPYKNVEKDCSRLLEYAKSGSLFTKFRAAICIIDLASEFPPVGHYMTKNNALALIEALEVDCLYDEVKNSCAGLPFQTVIMQNARLCLVENQANVSAWNMLSISAYQEKEIEGSNYMTTVDRFNVGLYGLVDACRNSSFRSVALRYLHSTLRHEDLTRGCRHLSENVLSFIAINHMSFWKRLYDVLVGLIAEVPTELDQGLLSTLEQLITFTLTWTRNLQVDDMRYMFELLYLPTWRTNEEAEAYNGFVLSLLNFLVALKGVGHHKLFLSVARDAGIYCREIQENVDWFVLYGLMGHNDFTKLYHIAFISINDYTDISESFDLSIKRSARK